MNQLFRVIPQNSYQFYEHSFKDHCFILKRIKTNLRVLDLVIFARFTITFVWFSFPDIAFKIFETL